MSLRASAFATVTEYATPPEVAQTQTYGHAENGGLRGFPARYARPVNTTPAVPESPDDAVLPPALATPTPPRVWTVFLAFAVMLALALLAAVVLLGVAIASRVSPGVAVDREVVRAAAATAATSARFGAWSATATAASQVLVAVFAAALSRERLVARLSAGPSRLGFAGLAVATVAAIAVSSAFDAAFGALGLEQSGNIESFGRLVRNLSPRELAVAVLVTGAFAPVAEELFFRGYLQTRLTRRFGGWPGIVVTSALFGLVHLDRIHTPSAFLIGLYLGWLTLRTGSIRPAMLAHAANNALWVLATWARFGTGLPRLVHAALLIVYAVTIVFTVRWLARRTGGGPGERLTAPVGVG
jgi:membrane protease YdiL (CAAX protease family)